jgi:DNA-binding NarL/FixJ family response regulator
MDFLDRWRQSSSVTVDGYQWQRLLDSLAVISSLMRQVVPLADLSPALAVGAAGAKSYLLKNTRLDEVIQAIHVAADGGATIDATMAPILMREYQWLPTRTPTNREQAMSDREIMLLRLRAQGYSNQQIAQHLTLAESTVKNNLSILFQKIGVRDRTQAVLYAISQGLVPKPSEQVSK